MAQIFAGLVNPEVSLKGLQFQINFLNMKNKGKVGKIFKKACEDNNMRFFQRNQMWPLGLALDAGKFHFNQNQGISKVFEKRELPLRKKLLIKSRE